MIQKMDEISEDRRCSRTGTPNWRCKERAMEGRSFCEKHHRLSVSRNKKRKMDVTTSGDGSRNRGGGKKKKKCDPRQPEKADVDDAGDGKELIGGGGSVARPNVSMEDLFGEDPIEPYHPTIDFEENVEMGAAGLTEMSCGADTGNPGTDFLNDLGIGNFSDGFNHGHVLACDELRRLFGDDEIGVRDFALINVFHGDDRIKNSIDDNIHGAAAINIFGAEGSGTKTADSEGTGGQCGMLGEECVKTIKGGESGVLRDRAGNGSEVLCRQGNQSDGGDGYGTKKVLPDGTVGNCIEGVNGEGIMPKETNCWSSILCNEGFQICCSEPADKKFKVNINAKKEYFEDMDISVVTPWDEGDKTRGFVEGKIDGGDDETVTCLPKCEGESSQLKRKRGRPKGSKNSRH